MRSVFIVEVKLTEVPSSEAELLLAMIRQLAISDGVSNVTVGLKELEDNLFSESPIAFAKFIRSGDDTVGFIIHSWKFATFLGTRELYMQAIYISEAYRRQGLATKALQLLAKYALAEGCSRIEWYVIDDNEMSNGFYDALGAENVSYLGVRRFNRIALKNLAGG